MKIVEEINQRGLDYVVNEYSLDVCETDDLICLNYNQIKTPKFSIADECRGLILEKETWNVVCRPLNRFYNLGEGNNQVDMDADISHYHAKEKLDGSLIKIYNYKGVWRWASRGTVDGNEALFWVSPIVSKTFSELVVTALKNYGLDNLEQFADMYNLNNEKTYLFELITPYNRVVIDYGVDVFRLVYLCDVVNNSGEISFTLDNYPDKAKTYSFNENYNELIKMADDMGVNGEGFVVYDDNCKPLYKIKGSLYVKLHHIRGNGLGTKSVLSIIGNNEQDEYLTYFASDKEYFDRYNYVIDQLESLWKVYHNNVKSLSNKELGLGSKDREFIKEVIGNEAPNEKLLDVLYNSQYHNLFTKIEFMVRSNKIYGFREWLYKSVDSRALLRNNSELIEMLAVKIYDKE